LVFNVILSALASTSYACSIFGCDGPARNDLKVTFSANPLNFWKFNSLPRTESDASSNQWTLLKDGCADKSVSLPGRRFILDGDMSVILVFDANGIIAGIQMGVPKSKYTPGTLGPVPPFVDDGAYWIVSAYFWHPANICDASKSRTPNQFDEEGTASVVYLQNGTVAARDLSEIPNVEGAELDQKRWTKGKCMPLMGQHYWYNIRENMNCNEFFPFCLLYNKGKFNGFCFAVSGDFDNKNTHRFEHPTGWEAKLCCLDPYPKCFDDTGLTNTKSSTMHVYLDSTPYLNFC